jgi:hypothetical protein
MSQERNDVVFHVGIRTAMNDVGQHWGNNRTRNGPLQPTMANPENRL